MKNNKLKAARVRGANIKRNVKRQSQCFKISFLKNFAFLYLKNSNTKCTQNYHDYYELQEPWQLQKPP